MRFGSSNGQRSLRFADRVDAGRRLAERLSAYRGSDAVVAGLPRGGVPVAFEVAMSLGLPLDVIVVRKLGAPFQPELAVGAVGEAGVRVVDERIARLAGITESAIDEDTRVKSDEVERRSLLFRQKRAPISLDGRTVIVVDDGVATGSTCRAACRVARARGARRLVLAVPVGATESIHELADSADEIICLSTPPGFGSVGEWYEDFTQTSDAEVRTLLQEAAARNLDDGSDG